MIRETLQIFLMIGLNTIMGAVLANASELISAGRISYEAFLLGGVGGFLSSAMIVPLLWRRKLISALPWIYGAGLAVGTATGLVVSGPISLLPVALAVLTAAWIAYAKLPPVFPESAPGLCRSCGYDLRANASGTCPECGLTIKPPNRTDSGDVD